MAFNTPFEPALSLPVNFSVSDNKFPDSKEKYPKRIRLFIPLETVLDLSNLCMNLADNPENHAKGKVYDMRDGTSKEVDGIMLYGNGKIGSYDEDEYGAYGTINPLKLEAKTDEDSSEVPF